MIAFEVYVNKVKVCTAGLNDMDAVIGMLMCRVNPDGRPDEHQVLLSVSGINKEKEKAYQWLHYDLLVGNRIEIRVVDAKKTDAPKEIGCQGGSCAV
jgi:hypothetical protein